MFAGLSPMVSRLGPAEVVKGEKKKKFREKDFELYAFVSLVRFLEYGGILETRIPTSLILVLEECG
ncbi:hypothetical protein E2C01_068456 [Portunus trituberculatus]|uniref:Uncharacterized protein n=1 Tax=Portunus trituberculatus TaxID=210409 RepID=A0A5B7HWH7_PORTR|nr:hypothetical protein [Portunus trituberculatus]